METTNSKFSWDRVNMIARYYYPSLKIQLLLYPLVSAVFGILTYISTKGNMDIHVMGVMGVLVVGIIGMTQPFMLYFAPGFLVKSSRDIDVSIPALWTEKATFILLYFFVAVPILLYLPGKLCFILLQLIFLPETFEIYTKGATTLYFGSTSLSLSSLSDMIPLSVFAFVLFRTPKPSFGKAALFSIISLVSVSIIMGIAVFIFIIGLNNGILGESGVDFEESVLKYDWAYSIFCGLISALFIGLTAHSFKRIQV